jgi:hypothetical protein
MFLFLPESNLFGFDNIYILSNYKINITSNKKEAKMRNKKILMGIIIVIVVLVAAIFIYLAIAGNKTQCIPGPYECDDCIDTDGDGKIDYPADLDCAESKDNTESSCTPACSKNSDCGTGGYIENMLCKDDGNSYRYYRSYICENAGKCTSICNEKVDPYLWQLCGGKGCANGVCGST